MALHKYTASKNSMIMKIMTYDFNDMIIGIGMIVHLLKNDYFIIILRSKITFKFGIPLTLKSMNWKSSTLKFNG